MMGLNFRKGTLVGLVLTLLSVCSCKEDISGGIEYLDVTPNTLAGTWELVSLNSSPLAEGTYMHLTFIRKDCRFEMVTNLDSFMDVSHEMTGEFNIVTDEELGAVIIGNYDHDLGEWSHRYIVKDLTEDSMIWVAKDLPSYVQVFKRINE